jgi:putative MATE family efflux protein
MMTEPAPTDRRTPRERVLIEGPISRTLARFALPLLFTNILHTLAGTWNAIWVSRVLGEHALTAVVNSNIFMFMMMGAVMGLGLAAGVAIGHAIGSGNRHEIRPVVGTAVSLVLAFGACIAVLGWFAAAPVLDWMHVPPESRDEAIVFLRLVCLSMPSVFLFMLMMMMLRGTGDARTPLRFSLLWIGLGLVLSPALLTGAGGWLPRMGIAGVAVGGLLANGIALLALVATLHRKGGMLALRGPHLRHLVPQWHLVRMLVARGAPRAVESLLIQGSYFVLLTLVNDHGATTAAAYAAAAQLWTYVQMPGIAVSNAMSAMAAINIGAGRWDRVERITRRGCLLALSLNAAACLAIQVSGDAPLRLFLPEGGDSLATARQINAIVLWAWIPQAITDGLCSVIRANNAMVAPTLIYASTMWVVRVPVAMALTPFLGAAAIWWSFPAGTANSVLLSWAYYRWGRWRHRPARKPRYTG